MPLDIFNLLDIFMGYVIPVLELDFIVGTTELFDVSVSEHLVSTEQVWALWAACDVDMPRYKYNYYTGSDSLFIHRYL